MPNKFRLKFWVLVEVDNKSIVDILPYLGIQENDAKQRALLAQDMDGNQ